MAKIDKFKNLPIMRGRLSHLTNEGDDKVTVGQLMEVFRDFRNSKILIADDAIVGTLTVDPEGNMKSGQTDYDTGTGFWIGNDGGTPKLSIGDSAGNKITWNGTTLGISGSIVLSGGNSISLGQTGFDTGVGFWLGDDGGVPKFSVGDSAGAKVTWNGSVFNITGGIVGNAALADSAVNAAKIATNAVTADKINANAVTSDKINAGAVTADKISTTNLSAISADLGNITAGTIVLPSSGFIRSGQTAYDTGTGFYIGNDSGVPRFSIGNSAGLKITWDGTALGGAVQRLNASGTGVDTRLMPISKVGNLGTAISPSPLTASDAGVDATITIAGFSPQFDFGTLSVTGASITGLAYSTTYYVYLTGFSYADGSYSSALATTSLLTLVSNPAYFYIGTVLTPPAGGSSTGGGGGGGNFEP